MRVLLWTDYFWPAIGGTEIFALNLMRGLRQQGIEFEVVANASGVSGAEHTALPDGLAVHRLPIRRALARRSLAEAVAVRRRIGELLARFHPDLVHQISLGPGDVFLHEARRRAGVPCLVTLQQDVPRSLLSADATIGRSLRVAAWIAACSDSVRAELRTAIPDVAARCSVVHNALPDAAPRPVPPPASPRFLCLGRLVEQKGFDVALEAFAATRAALKNVRLVIAGDGPERQSLETRARQLGIEEAVEFAGWIHPQETAAWIDSATAVLMPSRRDPMALVGLETALRARPLIATRVGGTPEIVADGESGVLVDVDDAAALARAMIRVLGDPSSAARIGRAARARVTRLFPMHTHLAAYRALYERVRICRV